MHSYLSTYKHLHLCYFLMVHFHIHLSSSLLDFQVLTNFLALFPSEDAYSGFHISKSQKEHSIRYALAF